MSTKLIIGCGYLGRRIGAHWQQQGNTVYVTTRREEQAEIFKKVGFHPVICDVTKPDTLNLPEVETVVHCVGRDRLAEPTMYEVYVQGLANVLKQLPTPKKFIYVSSSSVYGQSDGEMVDETSATEPVDESGQIVLEAEQLLQSSNKQAIILRFAGIYGPDRLMGASILRANRPLRGNPDKWLNLIHVEDGVRAVLAAESLAEVGGIYNVCDDHPTTRREFYTFLAEQLQTSPPNFQPGPSPRSGNRQIDNRRMREKLNVKLAYPNFREGIAASMES